MKKILVIGGGPAGMMAAYQSAKRGADVTVIDHSAEVGKKILATGGGRCNLTNALMGSEFYHCADKEFVNTALSIFGYEDARAFFDEIGLFTVDKNNYIYPRSLSAASVRFLLKEACVRAGVKILTGTFVREIKVPAAGSFKVKIFSDGPDELITAHAVILACGGTAAPRTGSDGSGYELAKSLGHKITKPLPALMPLDSEASYYKALSGLRMSGTASLYINDSYICSDTGELQFTDGSVSGIPVFNISGQAARALNEHKTVSISFDFLPDYKQKKLVEMLMALPDGMSVTDVMYGLFPAAAADFFIRKTGIKAFRSRAFSEFTENDVKEIVKELKNYKVPVTGFSSSDRAQTNTGGIPVSDINGRNMQSLKTPGLYFAGEMMDVDGICGGYNLQWAWTTGYIAGVSAAE